MASLVKRVRSGDGWLGIFTVDVLPTAGIVSSMIVALIHGCWRACSTRAHSGNEACWRVHICCKERALCSTAQCHGGSHLC